ARLRDSDSTILCRHCSMTPVIGKELANRQARDPTADCLVAQVPSFMARLLMRAFSGAGDAGSANAPPRVHAPATSSGLAPERLRDRSRSIDGRSFGQITARAEVERDDRVFDLGRDNRNKPLAHCGEEIGANDARQRSDTAATRR